MRAAAAYPARMHATLGHIENWVFDLDNTLYPASTNLFAHIDARMGEYIRDLLGCGLDEARHIQKDYFFRHGTTLSGLMASHGTDPHHFLDYVHDIDMTALEHDAELVAAIGRLPGRKLVFTNGDTPYAMRVLERLGLHESFEGVHDIHATGYRPKPHPDAYAGLCARFAIDPGASLFAEDMARNLRPAKDIGMTTLWVDNGSEQPPDCTDRSFIDHHTHDLRAWLNETLEEL